MSFLEAIQERYATKMYDNTKRIDEDLIEQLKQVLHLSPSSINGQPWQFTFVRDLEVKAELAKASLFNEEKIMNADTLVVFSAMNNVELFQNQINEHLVQPAIDYFNGFLMPLGEPVVKGWFQNQVYLSLGMFLSACASMGIDATPMEGINREAYNSIINPDGKYTTLFSVAIGYRHHNDYNQPHLKPKERVAKEVIIRTI